ncbi:MAG TPA: hypothetical protein VFS67_02035 [Polyangiaceae bacterium]|nr:hypothetical protein [Polyangiaceae bacterium]
MAPPDADASLLPVPPAAGSSRDWTAWLFAGSVAAIALALVCQPFPPCVDYPQHLATAYSLLRALQGEHTGQLVWISFNGLFELATALLGLLLPLELAGRMVLALGFCLQPFAVWQLLRFARRPAVYAFAWLPCAYSFCLAWGFVNFVLGAGLATCCLLAWFEQKPALRVWLLALATAYAHVLGGCFVLLGMGLGVLTRRRPWRALLPGVGLAAYLGLAYTQIGRVPRLERSWLVQFPRWSERLPLHRTLLGSWAGPWDELLAGALVAVLLGMCLTALLVRGSARWTAHGFTWLCCSVWLIYSVFPAVLDDCWSFFQRFGHVGVLWLPAALPTFGHERRWRRLAEAPLLVLGLLAALNSVLHLCRGAEARDASAILADIPRGSHVAPVSYDLSRQPMTDAASWLHFAAYAIVRRDSEIPDIFARDHWTFPIHESWPPGVPLPPTSYQWQHIFDTSAAYARYFDVVLARTSDAKPNLDPRRQIFGAQQDDALLLSHHGRFWLYRFLADDAGSSAKQAHNDAPGALRRPARSL